MDDLKLIHTEDLVLIDKALNMFLCVERGKALSETRSHIEVIGVFSKGEFGSLVFKKKKK